MDLESTSSHALSLQEWERMKALISDQLDRVTTPLEELRESGTLAAISQIIQRGDTCKRARLQVRRACDRTASKAARTHLILGLVSRHVGD